MRNAFWLPQAEMRGQNAGLCSAHRRWGTHEAERERRPRELKTETARPMRSYGLFFFFNPRDCFFLSTLVCHRLLSRVPCAVYKVQFRPRQKRRRDDLNRGR